MKLKLFVAGLVGLWLAGAGATRAGEILVQTTADPAAATAGETGTNTSASARITVVMTRTGRPVNEQGSTTGNGTTEIGLPGGWDLTVYHAPAGGCEFVAVKFTNEGAGVYTIEVLPPPDTPACAWQSGQYTYVVRFSRGSTRGSALGTLTIP